ncbi:MAG: hypothetical protein ACLFVU_04745 [Phycisphaerae bacterium]
MALSNNRETAPVQKKFSLAAGALGVLLSLAVVTWVVTQLLTRQGAPLAHVVAMVAGGLVYLGTLIASAHLLLTSSAAGLKATLVLFLATTTPLLLVLLLIALWGEPAEMQELINLPVLPVLIPFACLGLVEIALLMLATRDKTRLRYAAVVSGTVAAAVLVTASINLVAQSQDFYLRTNLETQGRSELSDRTKTILDELKSPVRITALYGTDDSEDDADQYLPPLRLTFEELEEYNRNVKTQVASTDSQRAAVLGRLAGRLAAQAPEHVALLNEFQQQSNTIAMAARQRQEVWSKLQDDSYLAQWGYHANIADMLKGIADRTQTLGLRILREQRSGQLPDYATLTDQIRQEVQKDLEEVGEIQATLQALGKIPPAVRAQETKLLDAVKRAAKTTAQMQEVLETKTATQPAEIQKTVEQLGKNAVAAAEAFSEAMEAVNNITDEQDLLRLIENSRAWSYRNTSISAFLQSGRRLRLLTETVSKQLESVPADQLENYLVQLRVMIRGIALSTKQVHELLPQAIETLTTPAGISRDLLQQAEKGTLLTGLESALDSLLRQAQDLPELTEPAVAAELQQENVVIIEIEDSSVEVVPLDSVWPRRLPSGPQADQDAQRIYRGESAVASRILSMTREPFATVVLTYWLPPGQAGQQMQRMAVTPQDLYMLREQLENANFQVVEWNVAQPRPETQPGRPQVLMVLPPANIPPNPHMQVPQFGPEQSRAITGAIQDGTPAIFLTGFQRSSQLPEFAPGYPLNDYLITEWGIEVKQDYFVLATVADPDAPDRFRININRFLYYPLSLFEDHPIGRPLVGQELLWTDLCPITPTDNVPEGVKIEPILRTPPEARDVWATQRMNEIISSMRETESSFVEPKYAEGDLRSGFPVAVAASGDKSRIVVLGTANSMIDPYLLRPRSEFDRSGAIRLSTPPTTNLEVATNSVYWLIGMEKMIAAGPARVEPVRKISQPTQMTMQVIVLAVLPGAILLLGGAMWLFRKRS